LPWLFGVANHVIGDHRRRERRRLATLERLLVEGRELVTSPEIGLTPEMIHALRRLSAGDRDTLLLLVWGELSRDEVAAALGVPVGTVNSRIARARKRLAPDLAPLRQTAPTELQLNGESNG
jgi:DNA-directed RNA polymerase specialized sigma24 family protein